MGRGLFAGAKMAKDRQKFRWSDRRYKKRMLKSRAKHDPLAGSTQAKESSLRKSELKQNSLTQELERLSRFH